MEDLQLWSLSVASCDTTGMLIDDHDCVGGRGGAIIIVLWNAPIIPINGPSVMRLMVGDLICITLA